MLNWVGPLWLCNEEVHRVPARVAGVYLLHSFSSEFGGYPVFYVGQTIDLRRRLLEHLSIRTAKLSIAAMQRVSRCYFSAAPLERPEMRLAVEAGLITALRSPCNEHVPAGHALIPNLPPLRLTSNLQIRE